MKVTRLALCGSALGFILALPLRAEAQGVHNAHQPPDGLAQAVRDATRQFLDVSATAGANYFPVLGCVSGQQEGAMGLHYLNGAYLFDKGNLQVDQPEALLYEFNNGKATLTAVEYIAIASDWDAAHPTTPPALLGQLFTYTGYPNRFGLPAFYALHVWAWKDNPSGTFVDWNPQVTCDGVTANPQ
jgi:hypothetical protein